LIANLELTALNGITDQGLDLLMQLLRSALPLASEWRSELLLFVLQLHTCT
jgi:hypothetical protein